MNPQSTTGSIGLNLGNGYSNRAWVDQISSIIGTNSVNINVDNNTNIVGALIANKGEDGNDLGNLNLSTASLTYSDLKNFSVSESNQFSANLQAGINPNNPTMPGSLALNLSMQGSESSSDTKATIGSGNINIGGAAATADQTLGLNRDIGQVEQNKRDVLTSDFDASLKIDLRLIAAAGNLVIGNTDKAAANWNSYANDTANGAKLFSDVAFGTNYSDLNPKKTESGKTSADAIPGTLPWFSRYANENNTVVKEKKQTDGSIKQQETNYPAPNLLPGFGNDPIMGIANETCASSACYYLGSDQAPLFKAIHQTFPGADSDSAFHDAGKYSTDPLTTAATIPPYFLFNKIGAIGTFFDVPNWKQNFVDPNTNIFRKPITTETIIPAASAVVPNIQPSQGLPNSSNSLINSKLNEVNHEQGINP